MSLFCRHVYVPLGTNRGESALGLVTYSVDWKCRRCLRVKHESGYNSRAEARHALRKYRELWCITEVPS